MIHASSLGKDQFRLPDLLTVDLIKVGKFQVGPDIFLWPQLLPLPPPSSTAKPSVPELEKAPFPPSIFLGGIHGILGMNVLTPEYSPLI